MDYGDSKTTYYLKTTQDKCINIKETMQKGMKIIKAEIVKTTVKISFCTHIYGFILFITNTSKFQKICTHTPFGKLDSFL